MQKFKKGLNWRFYFTFLTLFLTIFGAFQPLIAQAIIDRQLYRTELLNRPSSNPFAPNLGELELREINIDNIDPVIIEFSQALIEEIIAEPETTKKILSEQISNNSELSDELAKTIIRSIPYNSLAVIGASQIIINDIIEEPEMAVKMLSEEISNNPELAAELARTLNISTFEVLSNPEPAIRIMINKIAEYPSEAAMTIQDRFFKISLKDTKKVESLTKALSNNNTPELINEILQTIITTITNDPETAVKILSEEISNNPELAIKITNISKTDINNQNTLLLYSTITNLSNNLSNSFISAIFSTGQKTIRKNPIIVPIAKGIAKLVNMSIPTIIRIGKWVWRHPIIAGLIGFAAFRLLGTVRRTAIRIVAAFGLATANLVGAIQSMIVPTALPIMRGLAEAELNGGGGGGGESGGDPGGPIVNAWKIVRNLVNMTFIVILAWIGIATILRVKEYEMGKILPIAVLMIVLVQFTPAIVNTIVGITNDITEAFLGASMRGGIAFARMTENVIEASRASLRSAVFSIASGRELFEFLLSGILYLVYVIVLALVILISIFLFLARQIAIFLLFIISPIAFASYILPATRKIWNGWWEQFLKWSFVGVILSFCIFISLSIATDISPVINPEMLGTRMRAVGEGMGGQQVTHPFFATSFPATIALCFLIGGVIVAVKFGGIGSTAVIGGAVTLGVIAGGTAIIAGKAAVAGGAAALKGGGAMAAAKGVGATARAVRGGYRAGVGGAKMKGKGKVGQFFSGIRGGLEGGKMTAGKAGPRLKTLYAQEAAIGKKYLTQEKQMMKSCFKRIPGFMEKIEKIKKK